MGGDRRMNIYLSALDPQNMTDLVRTHAVKGGSPRIGVGLRAHDRKPGDPNVTMHGTVEQFKEWASDIVLMASGREVWEELTTSWLIGDEPMTFRGFPDQFLRMAEEVNGIVTVTEWMPQQEGELRPKTGDFHVTEIGLN